MSRTISIIHPSYGRPELAIRTAKDWLGRSVNKPEYILCLCTKDPKLMDYERALQANPIPIKVIYCGHANMVKQMNMAAELATGDLLIAVSDDFSCPVKWDEKLLGHIGERTDIVVKTNDDLKNPAINTANIIALPIMDRAYYNRFKFIYHPSYNHFFGDEELSRVGDLLGRKINIPMTFEHLHYMAGKAVEDATNRKNNAFFQGDKRTFQKRERKRFYTHINNPV